METVHVRYTAAEVREQIRAFLDGIAGRGAAHPEIANGVKLRIGMEALRCIQEAFVTKAAGGTDEGGVTWDPLKPETIAGRKPPPHKRKGERPRGLLTQAQDKRWRTIFATRKAWLRAKHGLDDGAASAQAAQIAWATLKAEGAKTRLAMLGGRHVQILRDTGRLFNSLSPGLEEPGSLLSPPPPIPMVEGASASDRVLRTEPAAVIVGTNVEYAARQHARRPLWPATLPPSWNERLTDAAASGVLEALQLILRGAA